MKQISREDFQNMLKMGLLNTEKGFKNFSTTSVNKKSKRKKHYVSMPDYLIYLREKSKSERKIDYGNKGSA